MCSEVTDRLFLSKNSSWYILKTVDLLTMQIQNIIIDSEDKTELPSSEHLEELTNDVLCQV